MFHVYAFKNSSRHIREISEVIWVIRLWVAIQDWDFAFHNERIIWRFPQRLFYPREKKERDETFILSTMCRNSREYYPQHLIISSRLFFADTGLHVPVYMRIWVGSYIGIISVCMYVYVAHVHRIMYGIFYFNFSIFNIFVCTQARLQIQTSLDLSVCIFFN